MAASVLARLTSTVPAAELFEDLWTCQAVFRSLSPLAKQYVLRLLYAPAPVPQSTMASWLGPGARPLHEDALKSLFKVILPSEEKKHDVLLNLLFKQRLLTALHEPDSVTPLQARSDPTDERLEALARYSQQCWDKVLQFMVRAGKHVPSDNLVELIMDSKLMTSDGNGGSISNSGFQFLLKDVTAQMWELLYAYINSADSRGVGKKEALWFLFQMSFLTAGAEYSTDALSRQQQTLLQDLAELGIVQYFEKRFIPTQLGINLCSGEQYVRQKQEEGYIIVETNYRVYAYTTSDLRIALLGLFVTVQYRLANLAVGVLSRESVRDALSHGISATQIIAFLEQNAHAEVRRRQPIVPETVCDQIRLWESERQRVKLDSGVLYEQFPSADAFKKAEAYAKSKGYLIWANPAKQLLFVSEASHNEMKEWIKKNL